MIDVENKPEAKVEEDTLDFALIESTAKEFLRILEFKEIVKLSKADTVIKLFDTVNYIKEYVDGLSYVKRANKAKAILLLRIEGIMSSTIASVFNLELSVNDFPGIHANMTEALKEAADVLSSDAIPMSTFDMSKLFAMAKAQSELDAKFLMDKHKSKKKRILHRKFKADIMLHCSPTINDADAASVGLKFRIVEGYLHIRDQKVLMINSAKTNDQYAYARTIARQDGNKIVPMENIYYSENGVAYAWFVKPEVITKLFSQISINAWCCVRREE